MDDDAGAGGARIRSDYDKQGQLIKLTGAKLG